MYASTCFPEAILLRNIKTKTIVVSLPKSVQSDQGSNFMSGVFQQVIHELGIKQYTVKILCIGTDRSQQTVQTKIRLLLKKQSDQGLRCLPFHQHLLDALMQCYIKFFYF